VFKNASDSAQGRRDKGLRAAPGPNPQFRNSKEKARHKQKMRTLLTKSGRKKAEKHKRHNEAMVVEAKQRREALKLEEKRRREAEQRERRVQVKRVAIRAALLGNTVR
jgi:hypothetical protein